MQRKATIFVIIILAILFAFFVYQNKKLSRVAEVAPIEDTFEATETDAQNTDAPSAEELATVPTNIPTDDTSETTQQ